MCGMSYVDVLLVKAREHKINYVETIEDIRIAYVDSFLKQHNISTYILDFSFCSTKPCDDAYVLSENIKRKKPKIIIFFIDKHPTNGPAYTVELLKDISLYNDLTDTHITFYGNTHININAFFECNIDSVILGEESSALSLVNCIIHGGALDEVEGIAFLNDDRKITIKKAQLCLNLDELPFPTRYAIDRVSKNSYCASILASRGCFGKCTYCYLRSKEKYFGNYPLRLRSIPSIINEMESLYRLGVTEFYFSDDEFLQPGTNGIQRALSFAKEIQKRDMKISFSIYSRADCINETIVSSLSNVGLYCVFLGVESFSPTVLERYHKGLLVEDSINAINILKKYDIHIRLGMIMFDPQTTVDELKCCITTLKEIFQTKPELIFQSLFFSNAMIPLEDTPSLELLKYNDEKPSTNNMLIQENYERRSRSSSLVYYFNDGTISDIYTCVEFMARKLLQNCIRDEIIVFENNMYSADTEYRLLHITEFALELLDMIFSTISQRGNVEFCIAKIEKAINEYYR